MLYTYGVVLGLKLLLRGRPRRAYTYLVLPVNYWRAVEYRLVFEECEFEKGQSVLDIGSPKLLSLYLAHRKGCKVHSTDIEDYFVEEQKLHREVLGVPEERLHISTEDGRKLSQEDNTFDRVFSISVVEHIPEDGDTRCIQEIARVLKPGGRAALTVPFWPEYREEYVDGNVYWAASSKTSEDGRIFYQRRYAEKDLFERLIEPSGLRLRRLAYVGEKLMTRADGEVSSHLPTLTGPIQPMLSMLLHTKPAASWRDLKKPLCALVVLEK